MSLVGVGPALPVDQVVVPGELQLSFWMFHQSVRPRYLLVPPESGAFMARRTLLRVARPLGLMAQIQLRAAVEAPNQGIAPRKVKPEVLQRMATLT